MNNEPFSLNLVCQLFTFLTIETVGIVGNNDRTITFYCGTF